MFPSLAAVFAQASSCRCGMERPSSEVEVSDARVYGRMAAWGMYGNDDSTEPGVWADAKEYLLRTYKEAWYGVAFVLPYTLSECDGVLVVFSNSRSKKVYLHNERKLREGIVIDDPHWLYYEIYFVPGISMMNLGDLCRGRRLDIRMGDLIDERTGSQVWRQEYCSVVGGEFHHSRLRRVFHEVFRCPYWTELKIGLSRQQYRCLDVYMKLVSSDEDIAQDDAWWVLGMNTPWHQRPRNVSPRDWRSYKDWYSYGQRHALPERKICIGAMS